VTHPLPTRVTISPELLVQQLEDETVLLDLQSERYFGLDDVGTRMWRLLAEHREVLPVYERLLKTYQVDDATLRHDLAAFIDRLADAGLVTVEE
jgi:hypothetical protein